MKPIFIVDAGDALGFGLAGMETGDSAIRDDDAVYIVSASKADVVAQLPRDAPVFVLPSPPRAGEKVPQADEGADRRGDPLTRPFDKLRATLSPQAGRGETSSWDTAAQNR